MSITQAGAVPKSALELAVEHADDLPGLFVCFHPLFHEFAGVDDGSVIFAAKGVSDIAERRACMLAREEHGDLAREGDVGLTTLAGHICQPDVEVLGHAALDRIDGDGLSRLLLENVPQKILNRLLGDRFFAQGCVGGHSHEGAFESADVVADFVC